jgi:hypothetical protein
MGAVIPITVSSFHADKEVVEEAFCVAGAKAALWFKKTK